MNKRWLILGIILASAVGFTGCSSGAEQITPSNPLIIDMSEEPGAAPPPASAEGQQPSSGNQLVGQWSGTSITGTQTEPFTINSTPWKIVWQCETLPDAYITMFSVFPMDATNPDRLVMGAVMSDTNNSDTLYMYETGTFYLAISSIDMSWSVKVYK